MTRAKSYPQNVIRDRASLLNIGFAVPDEKSSSTGHSRMHYLISYCFSAEQRAQRKWKSCDVGIESVQQSSFLQARPFALFEPPTWKWAESSRCALLGMSATVCPLISSRCNSSANPALLHSETGIALHTVVLPRFAVHQHTAHAACCCCRRRDVCDLAAAPGPVDAPGQERRPARRDGVPDTHPHPKKFRCICFPSIKSKPCMREVMPVLQAVLRLCRFSKDKQPQLCQSPVALRLIDPTMKACTSDGMLPYMHAVCASRKLSKTVKVLCFE